MTQYYIGTKQILAYPSPAPEGVKGDNKPGDPGYTVDYLNGYLSWSPKDVFEAAYLPMGEDNDGSSVTEQMVEDFIVGYEDAKMGQSTTVVHATLRNGFTLVESCGSVDPNNYDHATGVDVCKGRIKDQAWKMLGFLLATARNGI